MICPLDGTPLIPTKRDGVEARSCLQCQGVWFSRNALESLAQKASQPATVEPPVPSRVASVGFRRMACPACAGRQLQTRIQGEIEVNRCRDCGGLWLAKSDVEKILNTRREKPNASFAPVTPEGGGEGGAGLGDFLSSFLE